MVAGYWFYQWLCGPAGLARGGVHFDGYVTRLVGALGVPGWICRSACRRPGGTWMDMLLGLSKTRWCLSRHWTFYLIAFKSVESPNTSADSIICTFCVRIFVPRLSSVRTALAASSPIFWTGCRTQVSDGVTSLTQ